MGYSNQAEKFQKVYIGFDFSKMEHALTSVQIIKKRSYIEAKAIYSRGWGLR
jgi:hypothetical protein